MSPDENEQRKEGMKETDSHLSERLENLGKTLDTRLEETSGKEEPNKTSALSGLSQAWKISSEFIAAIFVGGALGWMADSWLGTKPWGMIVLLLLGFAAGILNVLREAGKVAQPERRINSGNKQD
ncbi:ATP synthase protein I [Pseudovibrio axinellae]|uniref:ATP synthase protein I n=1 Tax=Pseudovibrio axinellae TaxID=989403 RepID=A0A165YFD0_9HYPH|nr:AtpZ/AtpI family protein [Pseudovibrio axinellae]KZL18795.1 ATP synthase protein I [Pseudovibrio axinellae]SEP92557.1 ATP synthase protein I [Pseudovibrio axinellae]